MAMITWNPPDTNTPDPVTVIQSSIPCLNCLPPGTQSLGQLTLLWMLVTGQGVQRSFQQKNLTVGSTATQFSATALESVYAILYNASDENITFGPNTTAAFGDPLAPGDSYVLQAAGKAFDLSVFYAKCASGGKTLQILYV